jgi:hypothetical protein
MTRSFLATCLFWAFSSIASAQLKQVQNVYLLPMGGGLDQYLANHLVEHQTFQIVTDPKRADAIIVDRIGEGLEAKLAEMYPDPAKKVEKDEDKDKKFETTGEGQVRVGSTNLQRGRGTIFMVDRRTHTVLWSLYSPSHTSSPSDVNRNAESIAKKLALALKESK